MKRIEIFRTCFIVLLLVSVLFITGCQKAPADQAVPPNPFNTRWDLSEEGRMFSISGNSAGHIPGKQSEFLLKINNHSGADPWQGEYCILLVDKNGVIKEITHKQFNIPIGLEMQDLVLIEFPENFQGPLGLCVVIPERATIITTLWVGTVRTSDAGPWPDIKSCP